MDPSSAGTGDRVLNRIAAELNTRADFSPLPAAADHAGGYILPAGAGRVDLATLFLLLRWTPPASSPADFPLVLTYKRFIRK